LQRIIFAECPTQEKIQDEVTTTMESTVVPESPANHRLQEEEPPAPKNTVPINTQQQLNTGKSSNDFAIPGDCFAQSELGDS
jgi:hypothetical protein